MPPKEALPLIRPCLILDDLSHSRLLQGSKYFISLCLRNRRVCHNPHTGGPQRTSLSLHKASSRPGYPGSCAAMSTSGYYFLLGIVLQYVKKSGLKSAGA
jgi:hypothetical protein